MLPIPYLPEADLDQSHHEKVLVHDLFYYGATGFVLVEADYCDMACSTKTLPQIPWLAK